MSGVCGDMMSCVSCVSCVIGNLMRFVSCVSGVGGNLMSGLSGDLMSCVSCMIGNLMRFVCCVIGVSGMMSGVGVIGDLIQQLHAKTSSIGISSIKYYLFSKNTAQQPVDQQMTSQTPATKQKKSKTCRCGQSYRREN